MISLKQILDEKNLDDKKKIVNLLNTKKTTIVRNIIKGVDIKSIDIKDLKQIFKDDAWEFIHAAGLAPVASKFSSDWRAEQSKFDDLVDDWAEKQAAKIIR